MLADVALGCMAAAPPSQVLELGAELADVAAAEAEKPINIVFVPSA